MRVIRVLEAACVAAVVMCAPALTARAASNMSFGITVGTELPRDADTVRVGRETFHVYHGSFYQHVKIGYVLVPAPLNATIGELPRGANRFKIGRTTYYRHAGVYFRATGRHFRVCAKPAAAPPEEMVAESETAPQLFVQLGDDTYIFQDGRFYLQSSDGLLGRSIPMGAIAKDFPREAMSVWFRDREFFECNGVFFQESPQGFKVVPPPWQKRTVVTDDTLAQASAN